MNIRQVKILAIVLVILLAGLFATRLSDNQSESIESGILFPNFREQINDISELTVRKADESLTIRNKSGEWVLADRDDYPADTGKLRKLLLTLADARKIEQKTSNPGLYAQLGVEDPGEESDGTELRIAGTDPEYALIIGNLAQRKYRYARVPGESVSWLIDQNPIVPGDAGGWLLQEILDIDSTRIQSVTITHSDGESIHIEKDHRAATNFAVADIPDGRELSYPSVVDSIAGVLSELNLQDVAKASGAIEGEDATKTVYTTFDRLEITVDSAKRDDSTWITVSARKTEMQEADESGDESEKTEETDIDPQEADKINERLGGWSYQIQSYKASQLRRRWEDILKAED